MFEETPSEALGRNGLMKVIGLNIWVLADEVDEVVINPINSKGVMGRCHICFPQSEAVRLANILLRMGK